MSPGEFKGVTLTSAGAVGVGRDPFRETAGADRVSKPSPPTTHVFSGHTNQSPAQAQPAEGRKLSLGSLILPVMSENLGYVRPVVPQLPTRASLVWFSYWRVSNGEVSRPAVAQGLGVGWAGGQALTVSAKTESLPSANWLNSFSSTESPNQSLTRICTGIRAPGTPSIGYWVPEKERDPQSPSESGCLSLQGLQAWAYQPDTSSVWALLEDFSEVHGLRNHTKTPSHQKRRLHSPHSGALCRDGPCRAQEPQSLLSHHILISVLS